MAVPRTRIDHPSVAVTPDEAARQAVPSSSERRVLRRVRTGPSKFLRAGRIMRAASRFMAVAREDGPTVAAAKAYRKIGKKLSSLRRRLGLARSRGPFSPFPKSEPYQAWRNIQGANRRRRQRFEEIRVGPGEEPFFSIIVPVYNPPLDVFRAMIQSVVDQSYESWELVLADDASPDPRVREEIDAWANRDHRIKAVYRRQNGNISLATNTAAEAARGEFLILADHDDLLTADALAHVAIHLEENPGTDLLYSDDDKVGLDGNRHSEQFKPDWSPELLLSFCYTGHLTAVRSTLYREVGGMRAGFEGSQDHDFWLRASERAARIGHIPQVLYHWRVLPGSTAASGDCKPASFEAGRRAVEEAFHRRGVPCKVVQKDWAAKNACSIFEPVMPDDGPSVAILIPTRNHRDQLKLVIESLSKTTYRNYRVVVIDNESDDPATLGYLETIPHRVLRIPNRNGKFSFAAINNEAVRHVEEDLIVFLNDDAEVINPRWLSQMVGWAQLSGVGAVGARLLYPDQRIQHAGIVHGLHSGLAGHAFKLLPWWDSGTLNLARVSRDCYAVTAACMLTPRHLFLEMGGFDEERFAVAYNDADYGYRLVDAGLRCVYCAEAELYHHEGKSRGFQDNPREVAIYRETHGHRTDPYFSPHLDPEDETFQTKPTIAPISRAGNPIAVLGVTHNLNWEGAPRFEFEILAELQAAGAIRPTVLSPCEGPLRKLYEEAGIESRVEPGLGGISTLSPEAYQDVVTRLAATFKAGRYEVIHANTLQSFWAVDAARIAGVPSIWSVHESEPWQTYFDGLHPQVAAAALSCMAYPYRVVFSARSTAEVWADLDTQGNFGLIHWALDSNRFLSELEPIDRHHARKALLLDDQDLCVLALGTVCERKGQKDLVRAFADLPREVAGRMRCVVVGARDTLAYSRELRDMAGQLPADRRDRFQIIPETGETATYWRAADVFCCTSRIESYPHVTQEAMAAGLPLLTTPVFGLAEQVRESVNALTYQPGDVRALARLLARLATDDRKRREMAEAAPLVLRSLPDPRHMNRRYLQLFRAAAESAAPVAADRRQARSFGAAFRRRAAAPTASVG